MIKWWIIYFSMCMIGKCVNQTSYSVTLMMIIMTQMHFIQSQFSHSLTHSLAQSLYRRRRSLSFLWHRHCQLHYKFGFGANNIVYLQLFRFHCFVLLLLLLHGLVLFILFVVTDLHRTICMDRRCINRYSYAQVLVSQCNCLSTSMNEYSS